MPRIYHLLDFAKPQGLVHTSKSSGRHRGKPLPKIMTRGVLTNRPAWERENTILEISDGFSEDDEPFEVVAFGRNGKTSAFPAPPGAEGTFAPDMGWGNGAGHVSLLEQSVRTSTQLGEPVRFSNLATKNQAPQPWMNGSAHFLDDTYDGTHITSAMRSDAPLALHSQGYCPSNGDSTTSRAAGQDPGSENRTFSRLGDLQASNPSHQLTPALNGDTQQHDTQAAPIYEFDEEIDHFVATQAANLEPDPNDFSWLQDFQAFDPTGFSNPAPSNTTQTPSQQQQQQHQQQHLPAPIHPLCQCQAYTNNTTSFGPNTSLPDHALQRAKEIFPRVSNLPNRYFTTGVCDPLPRADVWGRPYRLVCKVLIEHCYDAAKKESFEVVWMQGEWTTSLAAATQSLANMVLAVVGVWKGRIPVLPDKLFGGCSICARQRPPGWVI